MYKKRNTKIFTKGRFIFENISSIKTDLIFGTKYKELLWKLIDPYVGKLPH